MPLKLCVGLSRKVGERNYGSRGAFVNFELELDTGAVQQPDRLLEHIRRLHGLARESIAEELSAPAANASRPASDDHPPSDAAGIDLGPDGVGLANPTVRPATESQVKAIYSLAKRRQLDLAALMCTRFSVDRVEDLSLPAASALIDELKQDAAAA
jgi:hypothetical protein